MAVTPILNITQVAPNQTNKETTINDGFIAMERSFNDIMAVDLSAGNVEILTADYTRAWLYDCTGHVVARDLTVPASKRNFAVYNGGTEVITVKVSGTLSSTTIPVSSFVTLFNTGTTVRKISDSAASGSVTSFLDLPDTPSSFTGESGRAVVVNGAETALEFGTITVQFTDLTDAPSSYVGEADKIVKVNAGATGIEFGTYYSSFIQLTDTPITYLSQAGKMVVVNTAEDALEFQDVPDAVIRDTREFSLDNAGFELDDFTNWTVPSTSGSVWLTGTVFGLIGAAEGTYFAYHDFEQGNEPTAISYEIDLTEQAYAEEIDQESQLEVTVAMASPNEDIGYIVVEFYSESAALVSTETSPEYISSVIFTDRRFLCDIPEFARSAIIYLNAISNEATTGDAASVAFAFDDLRVSLKLEVDQISTFVELFDTPLSYTGHASKMVVVNVGETALEFAEVPELRDYFTQLIDTPADYVGHGGKVLKVNSGETAVEFDSFTFTGLTDTPASLAGQSGKWLKVNVGETALEFTDAPSSVGALDDLTDVNAAAPSDGYVLTYDSGSGEWIPAAPTGGGGSTGTAEWSLTVSASDETSDLTTGDSKLTFFMPVDVDVSEVFISLSGQSSSGDVTIDMRLNGTTVFATPPSINASEDTSLTGTVAVMSVTDFDKGDKIEIDIDAAGTGASGLKVTIIGQLIVAVQNLDELGDVDTTGVSSGDVLTFDGVDWVASAGVGKHTVWNPAAALVPAVTSGPASLAQVETGTNDINVMVLDFDATADEHAHFNISFPKSWDKGTVTFQVLWTTTATDTDGVAWGLQGVAISDNEAMDASWGTAVVVTDDAQGAASEILVTAESAAVTIGGTPANDDICFFRIFRDVSDANDDMTEDARLIGVKVFYTTNALTDA